MNPVVYNGDERYPGPQAHLPPSDILGIPSQAELDAFPRMFTWGELKEIIYTSDLERLMRNKAMQARYDEWMIGKKKKYGSTEKYLTQARLPWKTPTANTETKPTPPTGGRTFDISTSLDEPSPLHESTAALTASTNPDYLPPTQSATAASAAATLGNEPPQAIGRGAQSGSSTPSSAGFVSLSSMDLLKTKLRKAKSKSSLKSNLSVSRMTSNASPESTADTSDVTGRMEELDLQNGNGPVEEEEEEPENVFLRWDEAGLDAEKYAVLPNDWPYNIPYGVRHFCVWSRIPIAHPELVDYDPEAWAKIEQDGLGGFTGVTPLRPFKSPLTPLSPMSSASSDGQSGAESPKSDVFIPRSKSLGQLDDKDWYAADVAWSGSDVKKWASKRYTSPGGREVSRMVEGLWDQRGWECLWFVNPPRLQSVPGFSHFHVFARRKTPEEIDASEAFCGDGQ